MIPAMQVGLFFLQAQTIRNLLAAAAEVLENNICRMGYARPKPLSA
jgi:hypothetical protein